MAATVVGGVAIISDSPLMTFSYWIQLGQRERERRRGGLMHLGFKAKTNIEALNT